MQTSTFAPVIVTNQTAFHPNSSDHFQNVTLNTPSHKDDCINIVFSEMEFLPWDNPDNIVSAEVETIARQMKNNLLVLLFLIGGPANAINMAVFYKHGLQDRVNLCLFALSVADDLYLTASLLLHGEQLYLQFTTKETVGPIFTFLTNRNLNFLVGSCFISHVLSAIIASERCLCVFNPLRFQTLLSAKTVAIIIIVVSIVLIGLFFIVVFRYRIGCVYDPVLRVVIITAVEGTFYNAHKEVIDYLYSLVFGAGLPGIEMIVVTTATIMTIVKLRQTVTWRSATSSFISPKELVLTKILLANSIFFIACISPVAVINFSRLFLPEVNSGRRHHNLSLVGLWVAEMFSFINSTFNFFVYYVMGSRYRDTFWSLFGKHAKATKRRAGAQ